MEFFQPKEIGPITRQTIRINEEMVKTKQISTEMGDLWLYYMVAGMSKCTLAYFLEKAEDNEIKDIVKFAFSLATKQIKRISKIFNQEGIPVPIGFTGVDVNLKAPRLYADHFIVRYVHNMTNLLLPSLNFSISMLSRQDTRNFFKEFIFDFLALNEKSLKVLLAKGFYARPFNISAPVEVDFIKKPNYLGNLIEKQRKMNALEIMSIFYGLERNILAKELLAGFSQVAKSDQVRKYLLRGKELAHKRVNIFSTLLKQNGFHDPTISKNLSITNSNVPPFSDKLMIFHVTTLANVAVQSYGYTMSVCMRKDIIMDFSRLTVEILKYAQDGAMIMIKNGWLEEQP